MIGRIALGQMVGLDEVTLDKVLGGNAITMLSLDFHKDLKDLAGLNTA
jgi:hypothetical protein